MSTLEISYHYFLQTLFGLVNPFKKSIIKTKCEVHKFINIQALNILKNDDYINAHTFFNTYIEDLNKGAVWADQDFKSSNHFYNPYQKKGLYGRKSAMDLGVDYYARACDLFNKGDFNKSLFFLGAALHILQDMTIPQHANIRLLDQHHQYESFVKQSYRTINKCEIYTGSYLLTTMEDYIQFNAQATLKIHRRFKDIKDNQERYGHIAKSTLPLAKRTTAGAMIMFYKEIF